MSNKKLQVWLPLLLAATLVAGMFFGYKLKDNMGHMGPSFPGKQRKTNLQEILDLVARKYVDTVNTDSLARLAIENIFTQLDPHSSFIPADQVKQMNDELQGNFEGIGVEFELLDDTVTVLGLSPKSPAEAAGILVGDKILRANDSIVSGVQSSPDRIRKIVRGPRGTNVSLLLLRNKDTQIISVSRGVIPLKSVDAAYLIEDTIGYIRLNKFASSTYEEFMEQLEQLKENGMKQLILDLRDNGGGMLDDAVQIADEFLGGSKEIVYTSGKSTPKQIYTARRPGLFENGRLVVLINEGSASASEVLTGALQDWDRATIIGRRSFGKGLVQEQFNLSDGSAIRLTVSRYFTPVGRSIQKPFLKGNDSVYEKEVADRYTNGEVFRNDTSYHSGTPYRTKGGRRVYGGGGISPDIFVPLDSSEIFLFKNTTIRQAPVSKAAFTYYITRRQQLQSISSAKALIAYLEKDPLVWSQLETSLQKEQIATSVFTPSQKAYLLQQVYAMVARQLWKKEGYIRVMNEYDPMIQKTLEYLRK
jgi:carboxyl-terminal processing protease